jgi:hypothetical protein
LVLSGVGSNAKRQRIDFGARQCIGFARKGRRRGTRGGGAGESGKHAAAIDVHE